MTKELYDGHCRRKDCRCDHTICYRGWVDNINGNDTIPCQYCRAHLHRRWYEAARARAKHYPIEAIHSILRGDGRDRDE